MKTQSDMLEQLVGRAGGDEAFRAQLVADPKKAIKDELGVEVPEGFRIEVHEDGADVGHLVLPPTGELSEAELGAVSGGWKELTRNSRPYNESDRRWAGG